MVSELESDIKNGKVYISTRFTPEGEAAYPKLLKVAIETGTEATLATSIDNPDFFKLLEANTSKTGIEDTRNVSDIAYLTFAEGEFNTYYMRGLCLHATNEGRTLEIYRAKEVGEARNESVVKIGTSIDAVTFLEELRSREANHFKYPVSGWLGGPNSGLSVKLI
ncbi:hypothetical protein COB87_000745 [Candidatus Wolfebacteria bacterium]|nr:hypothetical protein [Candidatus Wolfebacteria bacterium]